MSQKVVQIEGYTFRCEKGSWSLTSAESDVLGTGAATGMESAMVERIWRFEDLARMAQDELAKVYPSTLIMRRIMRLLADRVP